MRRRFDADAVSSPHFPIKLYVNEFSKFCPRKSVHAEIALPALFIMHFLLVVCFRRAPILGATRLTSIHLVDERALRLSHPFYRIVRRIRCYV
jgi:hypothetical protein